MMNQPMMRRFILNTRIVILVACATLTTTSATGQNQVKTEAPWQSWLVRIEHVNRCDFHSDDAKRIEELAKKVEQAETPRAKSAAEGRLKQGKISAAARAGFLIYGWSMHADSFGRSVTDTSSKAGFFVPGRAGTEKLLGSMQPGDCIAIDRRGSQELFTFSGRKFIKAQRGIVAPANTKLKSQAFSIPPQKPLSDVQQSIELKLNYSKTTPRSQNTLHRYSLRVQADSDATSRGGLTIWLQARIVSPDGEIFGPIIDSFDVPRSSRTGQFDMTRGFDLICFSGFEIDPKLATIELIAAK